MDSPGERVIEVERELSRLREELNRSRMEKELLEWEKSQAETPLSEERIKDTENPQPTANSTKETPSQRKERNQQIFQEVDSEVRFKLPQQLRANDTGNVTMENTAPMDINSKSTMHSPQEMPTAYHMSTPYVPKSRNPGQNMPENFGIRATDSYQQQCSPTKDRPSNQEDPASFRNDYFQHQPNKQAPPYHKIAHTRRERPLLVPDRYNGNTSWDEYEQHFEACNQVNGWDDRQAAVYLTASPTRERTPDN